MSKLVTGIDNQPADAEAKTADTMGTAKLTATHNAGLADERARAIAGQAAGVAATEAALENVTASLKAQALERERVLTGKLGAK